MNSVRASRQIGAPRLCVGNFYLADLKRTSQTIKWRSDDNRSSVSRESSMYFAKDNSNSDTCKTLYAGLRCRFCMHNRRPVLYGRQLLEPVNTITYTSQDDRRRVLAISLHLYHVQKGTAELHWMRKIVVLEEVVESLGSIFGFWFRGTLKDSSDQNPCLWEQRRLLEGERSERPDHLACLHRYER